MLGLFYLNKFSYYNPFLQYDTNIENNGVVGPVYRKSLSLLEPIIERYFPQRHMQIVNCHTTFLAMDIL